MENNPTLRHVRRIVSVAFVASLLLPFAPAQAKGKDCATSGRMSSPRWAALPVKQQLKMTFCVDNRDFKVEIAGKGNNFFFNHGDFKTMDSAKVEYKLRDSKGNIVEASSEDLGDLSGRFRGRYGADGGWANLVPWEIWQKWTAEEITTLRFTTLPAGSYVMEMRLVVDWHNDNRGPRTTGWKKLRFVIDASSPPIG